MKRKLTRSAGFTLIELMVAMAVGLIISGVAVAVFLTSKTTSRVGDALARYQEGFRYASFVLGRDIRMAGFFGCNGSITPTTVASGLTADVAYDTAVRGYDNSAPAGIAAATATDVIKLQFSSSQGHRLASDMPTADATISVNGAVGDFVVGDYAVVADCANSAIFRVTGVAGGGSAPLVLSHAASGNSSASIGTPFRQTAEVFDFVTSYYYAMITADNRHVLMRRTLRSGAVNDEEIAEGVDDLQFLYGIDTDNDKTANKYVKASDVADWTTVLSVRVCMLTRSLDDGLTTAPMTYYNCNGSPVTATDHRLHAPSFFTVALRNRSS
jgi:type IV pilus assembly protein PilW